MWSILAKLRWTLAYRRALVWCVIGGLALTVAAIVGGHSADLRRTQQRWGATVTVWVARTAVATGEPIVAEARAYPEAIVPRAALASLPPQATAAQHIAAGEVLVAIDVTTPGVAGLIPNGWVAIDVPNRSETMRRGDRVTAYAGGVEVAAGTVVAIAQEVVTVAVPQARAGGLAAALSSGQVTLGLSATRQR